MEDSLHLTSRQKEILKLVSKGCSNSDIAQLLTISPNTVKSHIATILERLDVSNRTEASVFYEKQFGSSSNHTKLTQLAVKQSVLNIHLICGHNNPFSVQLSENLAKLLNCYEVINISYSAADNQTAQGDDSKNEESVYDFVIRVEQSLFNDSDAEVSLYESSRGSDQSLIRKITNSYERSDPESLIKHAVSLYRCALEHYVKKIDDIEFNAANGLLEALFLSESVSYEKQSAALAICERIIEHSPEWHLPYALKSAMIYRMMTVGHLLERDGYLLEMANAAKQAFSLNSSSSWSQLSFAYFAMVSSDLKLAKKHLEAALEENPCQYRAKHILGQILAMEGKVEDSIEMFRNMLLTFPRSEADGLCYGALCLLYYCAKDFKNSKQSALRALMYEDAPKIPMILNLISIAELESDQLSLEKYLGEINALDLPPEAVPSSLKVATRIVPTDLMQEYVDSLKRAGVVF